MSPLQTHHATRVLEDDLLARTPSRLYVDGRWREASDGMILEVEDPATGTTLATVANASVQDARDAMDAATRAQSSWAKTPARARADLLLAAHQAVLARAEEFALLISLEMGKPLDQARGEVTYGADFLRWYAEETVRISGRWSESPDGRSRLMTMKQPVGPTFMITPWNFPLAMGTRKLGPALAAGCTAIVKPAPQTPLTMLALAAVLEEVGVPRGVVNVLPTDRAETVAGVLIGDPRLRKLSFTGSTRVGRQLVRDSADGLLRLSMELGGNAPFLVFDDADLDRAVEGAMIAKMRNMGQACTAANRFLVHHEVASDFGAMLAERMTAERMGRGTDPSVTVGPLVDERARIKVGELVREATSGGARLTTGGHEVAGPGYFFAPTVLQGVPADARILAEEIFGPVAPIVEFGDDEQAIALANGTPYGLVAYAFTSDVGRVIRVSEDLEFGMVGVNQGLVSTAAAPFGGVKQSGFGREGGPEGIEEYLVLKYVGLAV